MRLTKTEGENNDGEDHTSSCLCTLNLCQIPFQLKNNGKLFTVRFSNAKEM